MAKTNKNPVDHKFVKINPTRGYGNTIFRVLAKKTGSVPHYTLTDGTETFDIYCTHCYVDNEVVIHTNKARAADASKIGKIGGKK